MPTESANFDSVNMIMLICTADTETAQTEQKEKLQQNFIEYFDTTAKKRHANSSESIIVNWRRVYELLKIFAGDYLPFSKIDNHLAEDFRLFMLSAPCGGNKSGTVSRNTAATYFSIFKAGLKQAFIDGYLTVDLSAKIKGIQEQETHREFLTVEERNALAATPCEQDTMKRAALFSALTGLRHCDIQKMRWIEIQIDGDQARLNFMQKKRKALNICPFRRRHWKLCGERRKARTTCF